MTPRTDQDHADGVGADRHGQGAAPTAREHADAAEAALVERGLRLRELGVLAPDDPAAARFVQAVERGFYEKVPTGAHLRQVLEGHHADGRRRLAVHEDGQDPAADRPSGTFEDFVQPLTTWPGRTVDAWLISDVTVSPTHRRRGVLRAMMLRSLADAADAGVPVAALTASEAGIYGRFGFGAATHWREVHIDLSGEPALTVPAGEGTVRREEPREIGALVDELHSRVLAATPGSVGRAASHVPAWEDRSLGENDGAGTGLYAAVHRDGDGVVQGVALYRFAGWDTEPPTATVTLFLAATPDAHRGLLQHLLGLDLVRRLEWRRAPEPGWVEAALVDQRRVREHRGSDDLYLRVLDLPAAAAGRGYAGDGEVVVAIEDDLGFCEGTWRLTVRGGEGSAHRVGPADRADELGAGVRLDAARFSGLWLGGATRGAGPAALAAAGVVQELEPGAAAALETLLRPAVPLRTLTGF